jgi:hypothetical protein
MFLGVNNAWDCVEQGKLTENSFYNFHRFLSDNSFLENQKLEIINYYEELTNPNTSKERIDEITW